MERLNAIPRPDYKNKIEALAQLQHFLPKTSL